MNSKQENLDDSETHKENTVPSINIYQCSLCNYRTPCRYRLKDHSMHHKKPCEIEYFKCPHCTSKYKRKDMLKAHLKRIHSKIGDKFTCGKCLFETDNMNHFKGHFINDKCLNKTMFKCKICSFKADLRIKLTRHEKIHSAPLKTYKCTICQRTITGTTKFKTHMVMNHENYIEKQYKCEYCFSMFPDQKNLKDHKKKHKDLQKMGLINCSLCSRNFFNMKDFKAHIDVHKEQDPLKPRFNCELCPYQTNFAKHFWHHKNKTHSNEMFYCDQCSAKTKHEYLLKAHKKMKHSNTWDKEFLCAQCDYKALKKNHLVSHINFKHLPLTDLFKCKMCSYSGKTRYLLRRHAKRRHGAHTDLKTGQLTDNVEGLLQYYYKCQLCDYTSKETVSCRKHGEVNHSKLDEPITLIFDKYCDKQFVDTVEFKCKPRILLYCTKCSFTTFVRSNLNKHLNRHKNPNFRSKWQQQVEKVKKGKVGIGRNQKARTAGIKVKGQAEKCDVRDEKVFGEILGSIIDEVMHIKLPTKSVTETRIFSDENTQMNKNEPKDLLEGTELVDDSNNEVITIEILGSNDEPVTKNIHISKDAEEPISENNGDLKIKRNTLRFSCSDCEFYCYNLNKFKEHVDQHKNSMMLGPPEERKKVNITHALKCKVCEYTVYGKRSMDNHAKAHARANGQPNIEISFDLFQNDIFQEIVVVKIANQQNTNSRNERKLLAEENLVSNQTYKCKDCNFKSSSPDDFIKHVNLHWTPEKEAVYKARGMI